MLEILWALTLTVCASNGACVSQVIEDYKDYDTCLAVESEYKAFPRDSNSRWDTVKYECKLKNGLQA